MAVLLYGSPEKVCSVDNEQLEYSVYIYVRECVVCQMKEAVEILEVGLTRFKVR